MKSVLVLMAIISLSACGEIKLAKAPTMSSSNELTSPDLSSNESQTPRINDKDMYNSITWPAQEVQYASGASLRFMVTEVSNYNETICQKYTDSRNNMPAYFCFHKMNLNDSETQSLYQQINATEYTLNFYSNGQPRMGGLTHEKRNAENSILCRQYSTMGAGGNSLRFKCFKR